MCLSVREVHLVVGLTRTSVHPPPVPRLQGISSQSFRRHFDNFDSYLPWKVTLLESFGSTLYLSQNCCHVWTFSRHIQIKRSLLCVTYITRLCLQNALECLALRQCAWNVSECVSVCSCVWNASVRTRQGWHDSDGKAPGSDGWKVDAEAEVGWLYRGRYRRSLSPLMSYFRISHNSILQIRRIIPSRDHCWEVDAKAEAEVDGLKRHLYYRRSVSGFIYVVGAD